MTALQSYPGATLSDLCHPRPRSLYEKTVVKQALAHGSILVYGAELSSANPASAVTMVDGGRLSILHFPAAAATAPEVQALSMAIRPGPQLAVGHVKSPSHAYLKQHLDAGMHGAILDAAEDAADVRAFLDRLFFSPLGNRPGGPAYASGFLSRFDEMVANANDVIVGGVSISTARGVEQIEAIVAAKDVGLSLVMVEAAGIARSLDVDEGASEHRAAVARVEEAVRRCPGVALGGRAATRQEVEELSRQGYRHILVSSDVQAVEGAFERYYEGKISGQRLVRRPDEWNPMNRWIREGKTAELGFLMTPDLIMARTLAAHSDALWIDAEHGPFAPEQVKALLAELSPDVLVFVRVQNADHPDIVPYLHAGARGIIAPNVGSAEEAARFVKQVKGVNPAATAVVMVETRAGLENVEAIASVPGIDVLHVGPYDLALSLRILCQPDRRQKAVAEIEAAARGAGIPLGGLSLKRKNTREMEKKGYRFLTIVSDQEAIRDTLREVFAQFPKLGVKVVPPDSEDPLARYVGPTVLRDAQALWQTRADGTKVRLIHVGDDLSVQIVRKEKATGQTYEHAHPETQITIIEKGRSRLEMLGGSYELSSGDMVIIPGGLKHSFTDMSSEIQVIDLLVPPRRRSDGLPQPTS